MKVMKFGGTSVADGNRIRQVLGIIAGARQDGAVCVVSSAMGGVTDLLLKAAHDAASGSDQHRAWVDSIEERHRDVVNALVSGSERQELEVGVAALLEELRDLLHGVRLVRECSPRSLDLIGSFGERLNCTILAASIRSASIPA